MDVKTMNSATLPTFFPDINPIYDHSEDKNKTCCRIVYTDEAEISFGYFYAIHQAKEYSDRSLQLTALCLKLNPANYTVWHFRRRCLFALCERSKGGVEDSVKTIQKELDDVSNMAGSNPKNYQIWYHRRALLEYVANKFQALDRFHEEELDYIDSVFEVDVKNYHAWSHRKWFISTIAGLVYNAKDEEQKKSFENMNQLRLWNEELEFSDNLIECDIRNNSAWNYRYFLVSRGEADFEFSEEVLKFEAAYTIEKIALDPFNESPWHYLLCFIAYAKEDGKYVYYIFSMSFDNST